MLLPYGIVCAFGADGVGEVRFFCEENLRNEVRKYILSMFKRHWTKAMKAFSEDLDLGWFDEDADEDEDIQEEIEENSAPAIATVTDYGVSLRFFGPLTLSANDGDDVLPTDALPSTLKNFDKKYPNVSYEGYFGYEWWDTHGSDVAQGEYASADRMQGMENRVYPSVGELLAKELLGKDFLENAFESMRGSDSREVAHFLKAYAQWVPNLEEAFSQVISLTDENLREELAEYIRNL